MSPADPLPDAEAMLSAFLRSSSPVAALLGNRVGSALPREASWPYAVVTRVSGGPLVNTWEDIARVQVDVWAKTKGDAFEVCRQIVAVLPTITGPFPTLAGYVLGAAVVLGPIYSPDPVSALPRYVLDVELRTTWLA